jgi:hypothetical protein
MERTLGRIFGPGGGSRAVAVVALLLCPLALGEAGAQSGAAATSSEPETVTDVLHQLSDKADVIFAGQVLAVRRPGNGVVEVEFRVDQAILDCSAGTNYTLREWDGLWVMNNQRYRVGQRLLMLLHAPGAAGMSSPVGGLDGAIPIRQGGSTVGAGDSSAGPQRPYVDLRWLGARLPRTVTYRGDSLRAGNLVGQTAPVAGRQKAMAVVSGSAAGAAPIVATTLSNGGATQGSVAAQQASVDAVIGMLASWQKAQHVAP